MTARMRLVYGVIFLGAAFISLKTVFGLMAVDADSIHALTLWLGVKAHGLRFLASFAYTPDNWLLSIIPFNFLSFFLFGATPRLVILSGWLVLAGAALVAGLLARMLGARRAGCVLTIMLLLVGAYAQQSGYAANPLSHDVTNLYGLGGLCCALRVIRSGRIFWSALLTLLLTLGTVSDPWMVTAYDLPLLGYVALASLHRRTFYPRHDLRSLAAASVTAIILGQTHLLGLMNFLPNQSARLAKPEMMASNALYLIKDLGGMFALLPASPANALIPALVSVGGCALVAWACIRGARAMRDRALVAFLVIAGLSTAATCAGFILLRIHQADFSGRFVINIFYLFMIAAAVLAELGWRDFLIWQKSAIIGVATLVTISGLITTWPAWSAAGFHLHDNGISGTIAFLKSNGLTYGYGPYHGINANAVTALSDGEVIIRPVVFNRRNGMMTPLVRAQTSSAWLTQADIPPGQTRFFVVVGPNGEECEDAALCLAGLSTQFGPPSATLQHGDDVILVWDHALLGYPYGVTGDYWGGEGWAWMGHMLTLTSRQPMQVRLRADPRNGPVTRLTITINGARRSLDLSQGQTMTVSIPPAAVADILASPDFPASLVLHKASRKRYAVLVDLPQPAP